MPSKQTRILVVEDDADSFGWLRRRLVRYGYVVEWAGTVGDALGKLAGRPCGVILDLGMPDGSGTSVLRVIRDHRLPIKVAVLSGADASALHADAVMLRPDAFFLKPVDAAELMIWLKSACP